MLQNFFLLTGEHLRLGPRISCYGGEPDSCRELQALVNKSHFGMPQRVANGINQKRLALLLAVLERHGGFFIGDYDVFSILRWPHRIRTLNRSQYRSIDNIFFC
jgi:predicted ATP-dependent serine protease